MRTEWLKMNILQLNKRHMKLSLTSWSFSNLSLAEVGGIAKILEHNYKTINTIIPTIPIDHYKTIEVI